MKPVQPTTILNIDQTTFEVEKMSPEIQQMIAYYDDWRQKEADLTSEILMARNAMQQLQHSLLERIEAERAEAREKLEAAPAAKAPAKKAKVKSTGK